MFCQKCGRIINDNACFCEHKLSGIPNATNNSMAEIPALKYAKAVSVLVKTDGIIWLIVGILQILYSVVAICVYTLFYNLGNIWYTGHYLLVIAVGVWNIWNGIKEIKNSKLFIKPFDGMVKYFEQALPGTIINLIYNIAAVGIMGGFVLCALSFITIIYVHVHKKDFENYLNVINFMHGKVI